MVWMRAAPSPPAVPARVVAGGTVDRAALAFEEVAPLHASRTSQRDVPTTLNTYATPANGRLGSLRYGVRRGICELSRIGGFFTFSCTTVRFKIPANRAESVGRADHSTTSIA